MPTKKETAVMPCGGTDGGTIPNGSHQYCSTPLHPDAQMQTLRDRVSGLPTNGTTARALTGLRRTLWEHLDNGGTAPEWPDNDPERQALITDLMGVVPGAVLPRRWPLMSIADLRARPRADALIGETGGKILLPAGITMLYGGPKCGKSFLALDWALCVATGTEWQGYPVHAGPVVYVFGEGDEDLLDRLDAWAEYHDHPDLSRFHMVDAIDTPLHLWQRDGTPLDAATFADEVTASLPDEHPALLVFDTVARCTVGANENASQDMGIVMQSLAGIKARTGAAILLVHHATKQKADNGQGVYRGSTAIHGAVNALYELTKSSKELALRGDSAKGFEPPKEIALKLENYDRSMVVVSGAQRSDALHSECMALLRILDEQTPGGMALSTLQRLFIAETSLSERKFFTVKKDLWSGGYIRSQEVNEDGSPKQRAPWILTESGRACLSASDRSEPSGTTASSQTQTGRFGATTARGTTAPEVEDDYQA